MLEKNSLDKYVLRDAGFRISIISIYSMSTCKITISKISKLFYLKKGKIKNCLQISSCWITINNSQNKIITIYLNCKSIYIKKIYKLDTNFILNRIINSIIIYNMLFLLISIEISSQTASKYHKKIY